jgi:pimeloyl-ACP methyl ester carboxylesterase
MAYWEWGDPANRRVLVCVHGLSRQGRDFDTLAADLCVRTTAWSAPTWWAAAAATGWPTRWAIRSRTYVADMVTLLARLDADRSTGSAPRWAG